MVFGNDLMQDILNILFNSQRFWFTVIFIAPFLFSTLYIFPFNENPKLIKEIDVSANITYFTISEPSPSLQTVLSQMISNPFGLRSYYFNIEDNGSEVKYCDNTTIAACGYWNITLQGKPDVSFILSIPGGKNNTLININDKFTFKGLAIFGTNPTKNEMCGNEMPLFIRHNNIYLVPEMWTWGAKIILFEVAWITLCSIFITIFTFLSKKK